MAIHRPTMHPHSAFVPSTSLTLHLHRPHLLTPRRAPRTAPFSMSGEPYPLPAPAIPATPVDHTLGEQTAVTTVPSATNESSWIASILTTRLDLPDGHPLAALRASCEHSVPALKIPGRRLEQWRFTALRSLYATRYAPVAAARDDALLSALDIRQYAPDTAGIVLVFVDGVYDPALSLLKDDSAVGWSDAGGHFGSISEFKGDASGLVQMFTEAELGPEADEGGLFPTLGNAIASDVAVLDVPDHYHVSRPVALVFLSSGGPDAERAAVCAPRLAVRLGEGAKLTLLESHASVDPDGSYSLSLSSVGVRLSKGSCMSHYVVNQYSTDAHFLSNVHANVLEDAKYELRTVGIGSKVGRWTVGVDLEGRMAHGLVHGALVADGYQIADLHSRICHNGEATTSDQLQKNIASDHGRTVFNGKIIVTKGGQQTDSSQLCRSLLLSNKACVDAMPVLEIAADDVQCSHGATVSDLQEDELFYCQSRGLSAQMAQYLLISGFALDVLGDCPFPTIRRQVGGVVEGVAMANLERDRRSGERSSI